MDTSQVFLEKAKKAVNFVRRHFFTLIVVGMILAALVYGSVKWGNAFFYLGAAIVTDWVKQFLKPAPVSDNPFATSSIQPWRNQWGDPSIRGTPANFLSNMDSDRYR